MDPREQLFSFEVGEGDATYSEKFKLDTNTKLVLGIKLSSNLPDLLYFRGSQRIELSGDELCPDEYESKMIQSGIGVAPNERFWWLGDLVIADNGKIMGTGVIAGNGELKIRYRDTGNPRASFETYRVNIYALCKLS